MSGAREGERDKKEDREDEVVAVARRVAGRNGGKSRVGTGVKRLEAVATATAVAAVEAAAAAAVAAEGQEGTLLAADGGGGGGDGGGRGVGGGGSSTTGQFEYPGEHGDEREEGSAEGGRPTRTHGPGA